MKLLKQIGVTLTLLAGLLIILAIVEYDSVSKLILRLLAAIKQTN